jgi:serine/threonine-protein kinase
VRRLASLAGVALLAFVSGVALVQVGMLLFVRSGAETRVPEVVGLDLDAARTALDRAGFTGVQEREAFSADFAEGRVSDQRPAAGSVLRKGRKVWLTVSLGERRASAPGVVGLSIRQAGIALQHERLETGTISRAPHARVPRGTVIAQDPAGGASLPEGGRVDLLVSLGPPPAAWLLPDLSGRALVEVEGMLARVGLRVGEKTVVLDRSVPPGTVLEQDPAPGGRVETGQRIDLVVSSRR